jgi:hypothetical protein
MDRTAYDKRSFRNLPREQCAVSVLLGDAAGPCRGSIHRHHVDPSDPNSRTLEVCNSHHQRLHALLRTFGAQPEWKRCPHPPGTHRYPGAREECERRLNLNTAA